MINITDSTIGRLPRLTFGRELFQQVFELLPHAFRDTEFLGDRARTQRLVTGFREIIEDELLQRFHRGVFAASSYEARLATL